MLLLRVLLLRGVEPRVAHGDLLLATSEEETVYTHKLLAYVATMGKQEESGKVAFFPRTISVPDGLQAMDPVSVTAISLQVRPIVYTSSVAVKLLKVQGAD